MALIPIKSYDDRIVDVINDNIRGDVSRGCTYKELLAYNPKEYDGKGGCFIVVFLLDLGRWPCVTWWNSEIHTRGRVSDVGMIWEDFRTLTREEFCPSNEMQKLETELWNHAMVGAGHTTYTDRFHELARRLKAGTLTDESLRNGSIKKNLKKRGNVGEPSKDRNGSEDNKGLRPEMLLL
ncbi:putative reverse transcriptase domain-containing protein [Tanacetum coccineum]